MSGDDIVERLRQSNGFRVHHTDDGPFITADVDLLSEAADAIEARDTEIGWLRAECDAIDALHQPIGKPAACCTCWKAWPCRTHLLLHPKEARK